MGNFTPSFTKEYEFDGDHITVTMNRLKRQDAIKLSPFMNDDGMLTVEDNMKLLDIGASIMKPYIKSLSGLVIDGSDAGVGTDKFNMIFEETYFIRFLGMMLKDLMQESFASVEDLGN